MPDETERGCEARNGEISGPVDRVRRDPAGDQQVRKARVIEFPEGWVARDELGQVTGKFRVPRRERRAEDSGEHFLVFLEELIEAGLLSVIRVQHGIPVFAHRVKVMKIALLT